ncbi:molybdate ABC transporter substrate-binding protein [uncultured Aeromicrobium sp.]|uniref:molybdate ABC transporter substrate-binding protein n=1 Tax=uncultured Aeromicrobium sp. TaxID=337820 RepID=UPI0025F19156|nr:molybdate ABC transporter substrate-binding protein [uncultured Aeromicrobium sp.]
MRRLLSAAAALVLLGGLVACGSDDETTSSDGKTSEDVTLTVFAAASLTKPFTEIGERFEDQNPGVNITFNFAGSSDLVAQLQNGSPADVFASADERNMTKATDDDLVAGEPSLFAANTLQIVTAPGNPKGIEGFEDLAREDVTLVICAPEVPCGAATKQVEENTGVTLSPASEESAVTDVLAKVTSGEADAGLVYVTDAVGAGDDVESIAFPEASEVVNNYPIATLAGSEHPEMARRFVDFVLGSEGQAVLGEAGFVTP